MKRQFDDVAVQVKQTEMFGGVNHLNMASIGHNCIKELYLVRCYWPLRSYTGNWGKIGPQEPSHCEIRHNTDPVPAPVPVPVSQTKNG